MERFTDSRHERSGGIVEFKGERIFDTGELLGQLHEKSGLTRAKWFAKASQLSNVSLGTETILSDLKANRRKMPFNHIRPLIEALGLRKPESNYYIAELTKIYLPEKLRHLIKVTEGEHQVDVLKNKNKALESKILRLECECLYQRYGGNKRTLEYLRSKSYVDSSTCLPLHSAPGSSEEDLQLYNEFKTDSYERLKEHKNKWLEVIKLLIDKKISPSVIDMVKLCLPLSAPKMLGKAFNDQNYMYMAELSSSPIDLWWWYSIFPRTREPIVVHAEVLKQYQQLYPANTKTLIDYYMAVEKKNSNKSTFPIKVISRPTLPEGESFYQFLLKKYQSIFAQSRVLYELISPVGDVISEDFELLESAVFNYYIAYVRDNVADVEHVEANLQALSEWHEEHYESCKSIENLGKTLICSVYSEITIGHLHGSHMCLAEAVHQFGSAQDKHIGAFGLLQSKITVDHSFDDIGDIAFDLYQKLCTKGSSQ